MVKKTYLTLCFCSTLWAAAQSPGGVSTNLRFWIKADAGTSTTTNNATVTSWRNQVNNSPSNGGTATYVSNNYNFNPGIRFNGSTQAFIFATGNSFGMAGTASFDLFTMVRPSNMSPNRYYLSGQAEDHIQLGTATNQGSRHDYSRVNNSPVVSGSRTLSTNPYILGVRRTGGGASNRLYLNGMNDGSRNDGSSNTGGNIAVGYWYAYNAGFYAGNINEIIVYGNGGIPNSTDRNKVDSYLAIKYGITLGNNSTPVNYTHSGGVVTWTGDSTYQNNIAGIGRDDNSALNQKVSKSVNSTAILTIATNPDFASVNKSPDRAGIVNDKNFLVIGDNNGALTASASTDMAPGFNRRVAREWKLQNTNYNQNASLQFSGLPAGFTWHLIWDADGDFTNGSIDFGALNAGGQGTFSASQLASGYLALMSSITCYKPAVAVGTMLDASHGITALGRAGKDDPDKWPMVRKGVWTALEAKTKGMVINRLSTAQIAAIPASDLIEGMMVYDTTRQCLSIYTSTDSGATFSWQCFSTQSCPD